MRPCVKYSLVGWLRVKRYCAAPPPSDRPFGIGNSKLRYAGIAGFSDTERRVGSVALVGSRPLRALASGTLVTPLSPRRSISDSNDAKKNVLFLRTGPPSTPPN